MDRGVWKQEPRTGQILRPHSSISSNELHQMQDEARSIGLGMLLWGFSLLAIVQSIALATFVTEFVT
jgi:hypothetical protein